MAGLVTRSEQRKVGTPPFIQFAAEASNVGVCGPLAAGRRASASTLPASSCSSPSSPAPRMIADPSAGGKTPERSPMRRPSDDAET